MGRNSPPPLIDVTDTLETASSRARQTSEITTISLRTPLNSKF